MSANIGEEESDTDFGITEKLKSTGRLFFLLHGLFNIISLKLR